MARDFGQVNVAITASTGGLTAGLANAGEQIQGFSGQVDSLSATLSGFRSAVVAVAPGLAALTTIAGVFALFSRAAQAGEHLHNLSQELGVAAGDIQVFERVASEAGVSQSQFTSGLRRVSRLVGELAQGSQPAIKAFQQLGLTFADLSGKSTADQFALIADRIAALPPHMQAAAAIDIFGKSGQGMLNFLRQGGDAFREMDRLLTDLGVKMSGEQVAAIEMMGDSLGRLSLPLQGLVNQFLAGLAPAITTASNLIVQFFAHNQQGWTVARTLAEGFAEGLRLVVGAFTLLYGIFQVFQAAVMKMSQLFSNLWVVILDGVAGVMDSMASLADASGMTDLAASLRSGSAGARAMADTAGKVGEQLGEDAAVKFGDGLENITNPFGAFDAEMANVQAAARKGGQPQDTAAVVAQTIAASAKELRAFVAGTAEGDSIRNAIMRGDPRLTGADDAKRTADASERSAEELASINRLLGDVPGFGQAQVALV